MRSKKNEITYCIWCYRLGRCDTSKDWGKLYKILEIAQKSYPYYTFWIIPVDHVGKGRFLSMKQQDEKIKELETEHKKQMKEIHEILNK